MMVSLEIFFTLPVMNWFGTAKKSDAESDEVLLKRYRETEDLNILAELYQRHASTVYYVCMRYLQDSETSKDAVMQIFEELIVKVNKQEINRFGAWLHVLSRNFCLMQLRSAKKMQYISFDDVVEFSPDLHQEEQENKEGSLRVMERCLETLPDRQKESISLFFLNEKCYKEIVELTGYSLNEVKSYIQNGKRNLKNCIDKQSEE